MDGAIGALTQEVALVARAQAEPNAFAAIYDHYYPRVYTYVRYRVGDKDSADDVTAQVFERVLLKIGLYDPEHAPFAAWLFALARNVVNDYLRSRRRHPWLPLDALFQHAANEPPPEAVAVQDERQAELLAAVAKLDAREREIIALKFAGGLTNRRIAELIGLGEKNVSVILYRAVRRLRDQLRVKE